MGLQKTQIYRFGLMVIMVLQTACLENKVGMQTIDAKAKNLGANPDLDANPDLEPSPEDPRPSAQPTPSNDPLPTPPPSTAPSYPPISQNPVCGGDQVDPTLYEPTVELAKAQSPHAFGSYGECRAWMDRLFGQSYNCSKMVSATLFGCLQSADFSRTLFEADFALPVFKATGQMEVPYDYYIFGLPACEPARDFMNTFTSETVATSGGFTSTRASIRAECVGASTMVIRVLSLH